MLNIQELNIKEAREGLKRGDFTARDLTQVCLNNIKEKDGEIHAFLEVFDDALNQAEEADKLIANKIDLPLLGIPLAIKDNILMKGKVASASSKILENYVATYDSTAVKKLKEAGAVIIGRTNMDEFAMGTSTENSAFGPTRNPHDLTRVPGGSSGGSAAALASGMCLGALGSDTGGSVRQPAAFCGVVGMKPTYGKVSRYGLIALGSSLDQISPFAKTVFDAELLYGVIRGRDKYDSTTIDDSVFLTKKDSRKTIGIPRNFVESEGVDPRVKKNFAEAEKKFKDLGYKIVDINLPHLKYSLATYYIILPAEISSNLARFDGVKYGLQKGGKDGIDDYFKTRGAGFGPETRRRIILGTYVLSTGYYDEYYGSAIRMKNIISEELRQALDQVDAILTPTVPNPPFKIGEKSSDPLSLYLEDIFTVPANVAGLPAISLPSGFVEDGANSLPLGIELTAGLGQEDVMFEISKEFLGE